MKKCKPQSLRRGEELQTVNHLMHLPVLKQGRGLLLIGSAMLYCEKGSWKEVKQKEFCHCHVIKS